MSCSGNGYLSGNELVPFPFEDGQVLAWSGFGPWSFIGGKEGYVVVSLEYDVSDARWEFSWRSDDGTERGVEYDSSVGPDAARTYFTVDSIQATWTAEREPIANNAQVALQRCFVDAGVFVSSGPIPDEEWPSIGNFSISPSGQSIGFELSAGGAKTALSVSASSERFPIASGSSGWGSYVVVLSSEGIRDFICFCASRNVSPPSQGSSSPSGTDGGLYLRLCARCVTARPSGLSSIRVYDGVGQRSSGPHFVLRGDVEVRPGNNMRLSEPDDEGNGIVLDAVPGAGTGAVPCSCQTGASVPSWLSSADGHVRIFNDTCYDVEPAELGSVTVGGKEMAARTLRIHAKCTACCQCEMYESIVNDRLAPIFETVKEARAEIGSLLSGYESAVQAFNGRIRRPSRSDVTLSLSGVKIGKNVSPKTDNEMVKGGMNRCSFTAVLRNASFAVVDATMSEMSATGSIIESFASWSNEDGTPQSIHGDSGKAMVGKKFTLYPGRSLVVSFVSAAGMEKNIRKMPFVGSVGFGLSYSQGSVSGSLGELTRSVRA